MIACSATKAPYCAQVVNVMAQTTFSHYVCASTETVVEVRASSTAEIGVVSANAVGESGGSLAGIVTIAETGTRVGDGAATSTVGLQSAGLQSVTPSVVASTSTAGAAISMASEVVGIAGGFMGVVAMLL